VLVLLLPPPPQVLRKRYWNMMEDMKGKIRVFARCR
jgi:Microtubule binding